MGTIRISDAVYHLAGLVFIVTILVGGYTEYLTGWQTFGIFATSFVVAMISEQVSNARRRELGLPSFQEALDASWQKSIKNDYW